MASFGKKKKISEYLYSKVVIIILLVVIGFLSVAVYKRYTVEREMLAREVETQQQKQDLLDREKTLKEQVDYLSGDRGIEEEIRKHFDVAKEGEKVIILTGEEPKAPTASLDTPKSEKPWYQFW